MRAIAVLLVSLLFLQYAAAVDVRVSFYDDDDQKGDAASYTVSVNTACTSCQGFGLRLRNSWESYMLSPATVGKNYTLYVYDSGSCSDNTASLTTSWGNIPGRLADSVDSWRVCPFGAKP